ncbi:MAG: alpha/beta fold hydrolase [Acidimicrobiales bacterium]
MTEQISIPSTEGAVLEAHLARPGVGGGGGLASVLLLHGFPSGAVAASDLANDLPELADRIATEMGWTALSLRFRGCGSSTGDFSLAGWVDDVHAGLDHLRGLAPTRPVFVCGFGTGGAVGLVAASTDEHVSGVAVCGSPADFDDWASRPERLLAHAHEIGVIKTAAYPPDFVAWKKQLAQIRATLGAEKYSPRDLAVLHGSEDELVPQLDARMVAEAHGAAELRVIQGAGHQLRHDPRALAILLGWLERTRNALE